MKKVIYFLMVIMTISFLSCDKNEEGWKRDDWRLYVNVKNKAMKIHTKALEPVEGDEQKVLQPEEIVKEAKCFKLIPPAGTGDGHLDIQEHYKDFENKRIVFPNEFIIDRFGELDPFFMEALDIRVYNKVVGGDIVAYIPNKTIKEAYELIKKAYDAKDYDRVYELFQTAYTAIPCTTKQWEALKAKGEQ